MDAEQRELLDLMLHCEVLRFGDFVGKSGRRMPYFFNSGRYRSGAQIAMLGAMYARAVHAHFGTAVDVLFGPAYKGIPLAVATAMSLHAKHGFDVGFCFNRKEAKDHGEGGVLVGHELRAGDRVVIVEDVTTAGTSIHESVALLRKAADVQIVGLVVTVDRQERGQGSRGTLEELADAYGLKPVALLTVEDIVAELRGRRVGGRPVIDDETYERILAYRREYGATRT